VLVYGDHDQAADPLEVWKALGRDCGAVWTMPPGIDRHAKLVGLLIEAGRLLQGVADAEFEQAGCDRRSPATAAISAAVQSLAQSVCRSWDSGFAEMSCAPEFPSPGSLSDQVRLRIPEGFAFYAVYPEAYIDAARRLSLNAPPRVIGVRSIGTSLAAVVAAALGAPLPVTVRPIGDPFERRISVSPELERDLLSGNAHFIIVDEGPGQSGSSFAAVAGWLSDNGVPDARIALLPSHAGPPGAAATEERRRWWATAQREAADFGDRWPELVGSWFAERIGPLDEAPREISGGAWRRLLYSREAEWPAVVPAWERRKFLVDSRGKRFLVKFAGLGRIGEEKLAIARTLHSEGLVLEPVKLVHGFLVEHWCEDSFPLGEDDKPLGEIGRYIGTRAKLLPATSSEGASVEELCAMIRRNVSLELDEQASRGLAATPAPDLERRILRVRTDNKVQPHEWLWTPGGRLIKTDAFDHHCGHDLIGCQDMAWDVAATACEFALDSAEQRELIAAVQHSAGRAVDPELLAFYHVAYLAFRLGQARLGAAMVGDPCERCRIARDGDGYAAALPIFLNVAAVRLGPSPWSVERRNEPAREQSLAPIG
jgi:hypothetical protein